MYTLSLEELVMAVRRSSQGFSRGSSTYRGVTHHPNGRWEARIGMPGSKHIYLGLFDDEASAARAYDRALVRGWTQKISYVVYIRTTIFVFGVNTGP